MQNSFSNQTQFKYGGKLYTFIAFIHIGTDSESLNDYYLNNENILQFQYVNEFNKLFLTGELIYVDKFGILDKYFQEQNIYLTVSMFENEQNVDNTFNTNKLSEKYKFQHTFIIDSFQITERSGNTITYKLSLIGKNWYNCIANLTYSTYNKEKEDIFSILQSLIIQSGQICEKNTFEKIKADVKIDYITQNNDNLLTCFKYLMNKMQYFRDSTDVIKFLLFNESKTSYQLFDITNQQDINGIKVVVLSLFKSNNEMYFFEQPVNMGSVVKNKFKDTFNNIRQKNVSDYEYNYNQFNTNIIKSNSIVNYMNSKSITLESFDNKFSTMASNMTYNDYEAYWNNNINIYDDTLKILNNSNSLVITIDGDLIIKPGSYIFINVDRDDVNFTQSDSFEELEKTKQKYRNFEGYWIVGKVRNIMSISDGVYRQNLVLFKNFKNNKKQ